MHLPELTIDLGAIQANYKLLREKASPAKTGAAVKANGYGLGVIPVAKALYEAGCRTFFTAYLEEAIQVRNTLPDAVIAPLHGVSEADFAETVAKNIVPVLNSFESVKKWSDFAQKTEKKLPAFVHLDSGMNRLGLSTSDQERLINEPKALHSLEVRAWISHFSSSDEFDKPITTRQRDQFKSILAKLPPAPASLCNSSGIFWGKDYLFDLVRPGVALYGVNPTPDRPNPMRAVVELKAQILQTRGVDSGMAVGYGATHRITRKGRIATLALGYADGYLRSLSGKGHVKIGTFLAPVVGRISMDLITVDVSDIPETVAHPGAMATVLGAHRPIDAVASEAGTIGYEVLTRLGSRFKRNYIEATGT